MKTRNISGQASRLSPLSWKSGTGWKLVLLWLAPWLVPLVLIAQSYSIDWSTLDGGGGTSTSGVYTVTGTIGQPDAGGPLTNGQYSLTGGFWSLYAVQMPGAPLLTIALTSTNTALVWWPSPSTGFSLQQNTNLNTTNWVTPPETIHDDGTNSFIVVNPPPGVKTQRFYRLHKR